MPQLKIQQLMSKVLYKIYVDFYANFMLDF